MVSKYVTIVYTIKMADMKILRIIRHRDEIQGAGFKWSALRRVAWFFQIKALNRYKPLVQQFAFSGASLLID